MILTLAPGGGVPGVGGVMGIGNFCIHDVKISRDGITFGTSQHSRGFLVFGGGKHSGLIC